MIHPYIDCAIRLAARGISPDAITAIECDTAEGIVHRLWEPLAGKQEDLLRNASFLASARFV